MHQSPITGETEVQIETTATFALPNEDDCSGRVLWVTAAVHNPFVDPGAIVSIKMVQKNLSSGRLGDKTIEVDMHISQDDFAVFAAAFDWARAQVPRLVHAYDSLMAPEPAIDGAAA